jgi:hypothetical protein
MLRILSLDPSGTGTTGICLIKTGIVFQEFKSANWKEHAKYIAKIVKEWKPTVVLYENTNYLHQRQHSGTVSLLKLIGAIESLPIRTESILVSQVKDLKSKLFKGIKRIYGVDFKLGQGWFYSAKKISLHELDALLVYQLWKERNA